MKRPAEREWMRRAGCVLAFAVLVLIIFFSFMKAGTEPRISGEGGDKWGHFLAYAALGCSLMLWHPKGRGAEGFFQGLLASALLGASIELLQPFFGRICALSDFLADAAGAACGLVLPLLFFA